MDIFKKFGKPIIDLPLNLWYNISMKNRELTHDFLEWLMKNYGVRLSMTKEDADLFERLYPDLAAQLEREEENETTNNRS